MVLSELVVVTQFYYRFITMDSFFTIATSFYNARKYVNSDLYNFFVLKILSYT